MNYKYKIQWLVNDIESLKELIKVIGVKSLDKIVCKDLKFKTIDEYNGFIQYPYGLAEVKTIQYFEELIKEKDISYFEVLRK